jgi:hypothetical protein
MNISLVVLKSGEYIVTYAEELEYEPKCHFVKPHLVSGKTKVTLTPWPSYTDDEHVLLNSTDLLTVCDPTDKIKEQYKSKVGELEVLKKTPEPVILTEEEQVPEYINDDYEPDYIEDSLS